MLAFEVMGLKVRHVFGMRGRGEGRLALERGEATIDYQTSSAFLTQVRPMIQAGNAVPLFSWGVLDAEGNVKRDPTFPDLPHFAEFMQAATGAAPSGPAWEAMKVMLIAGFAANGFGEHSPGGYSLVAALVCEVVMTAFFLLVILGATDKRAPAGFAPLAIGLTAFGVGIKKVIFLHGGEGLPEKYRLLLGGALVIYLVFGTFIDMVTIRSHDDRPPRARAAWRLGAAAVIAGVTLFGAPLPPLLFMILLAAACVAPILVDLIRVRPESNPAYE